MTRDTGPTPIVRVLVILVTWRIGATTIVSVILGLRMTYLTHTIMKIFVNIRSGEYHLFVAAGRGLYLAFNSFEIRAITAVHIMADSAILNMVIWVCSYSNRC